MKDIIDLVEGYWTLKKLERSGFLSEKINLSFAQFVTKSIQAIKNIEKNEK